MWFNSASFCAIEVVLVALQPLLLNLLRSLMSPDSNMILFMKRCLM
ncbi:hypothetical protein M8C21_017467 [Ambrosia artemisiifolia]|uniref:Uncharacterized protein n=1 Tax=Ambrosia artemisiifolia TaxID=4212 RepID=A0AAD5GYY1_AMBAR|nr:hypothetical protein M8C21_017467 [Ambrosia artemisiifolia]